LRVARGTGNLRHMSLWALVKGRRGASGFGFASTAEEVTAGLDLSGKHILITGVSSGLGRETARVLGGLRGARIIGLARRREQAEAVAGEFGPGAVSIACDLSEPESVRQAVREVQQLGVPLDVLVCNAGVMALSERTVRHGQELQFLTNHIGHFILVTGLLPQLVEVGRVVMLSSAAHKYVPSGGICFDDISFVHGYHPWAAYGQSKLANLLFARALARRFKGTARTANALHPGVIGTNLQRHMNPLLTQVGMPLAAAIAFKNIPQGAATQSYLAVHPATATVNGEYFSDVNVARSSRYSRDDALGERLWTWTEGVVAAL